MARFYNIPKKKKTYYYDTKGYYFEIEKFSRSFDCQVYKENGSVCEFISKVTLEEIRDELLTYFCYGCFYDDCVIGEFYNIQEAIAFHKTGKLPEDKAKETKSVDVPKTVKEDKPVIKTEKEVHNAFAEINRLAEEETNRIEKKLQTEKADREAKAKQDILSSKEAARLVAEEVSLITGDPVATPVEKKSEVEDEDETKFSTDEYAMPDLTDFTVF